MNISTIETCYGCMICHDICPKQCIEVKKDRLGHLYPQVNEQNCIDCGLCLKVCQDHTLPAFEMPKQVLASWRKDEQKRRESSSGGLATVIAETFIRDGGVVYGCAFHAPFGFKHIRCTTKEELNVLKGSKYVQSDTTGTYKQILQDLKKNRKVLLIGTPCQIGAAKLRLERYENFFTIDLVCHGVPSQEILKNSLPKDFEALHPDKVEFRTCTKFHFSAKSGISTVFTRPLEKDLFLKGFFTGLYYRESCYKCMYAQGRRVGDITLGDFWGVKLNNNIVNTEDGISLCMVNTTTGKELMKSVDAETIQIERPLKEAIAENKQLNAPFKKSFRAKTFRYLYPRAGFKTAVILSIPEIIIKNHIVTLFRQSAKQ